VRGRCVYGSGNIDWLNLEAIKATTDGSLDAARLEADEFAAELRQLTLMSLRDRFAGVEWLHYTDQEPRAYYINGDDIAAVKRYQGKPLMSIYGMPFAAKKEWFIQENARQKKPQVSDNSSVVDLRLHRGPRMMEDSQSYLHNYTVHKKLRVQIVNEDGTNETKIEDDAGGIHRAWISLVVQRLFHRETGLFEEYPLGSGKYRLSLKNRVLWEKSIPGIEGEAPRESRHSHLVWCEFAGMFLGKALFDGFICPAHLCKFMYQQILQQDVTLDDFKDNEPELARSWSKLLNCKHEAAVMNCSPEEYMSYMCLTMSAPNEEDPTGMTEVELKPDGKEEEVGPDNVEEYVGRRLYHEVRGRTERGTTAFCNGFWEVMQSAPVFSPQELEEVMCGKNSIDIDDWKRHCHYGDGYSDKNKEIKWFWHCVEEMSSETRMELGDPNHGCLMLCLPNLFTPHPESPN